MHASLHGLCLLQPSDGPSVLLPMWKLLAWQLAVMPCSGQYRGCPTYVLLMMLMQLPQPQLPAQTRLKVY